MPLIGAPQDPLANPSITDNGQYSYPEGWYNSPPTPTGTGNLDTYSQGPNFLANIAANSNNVFPGTTPATIGGNPTSTSSPTGATPATGAQTSNPSSNNVVTYYEMPDKATQDMLAAQGKTIKIVPRGTATQTGTGQQMQNTPFGANAFQTGMQWTNPVTNEKFGDYNSQQWANPQSAQQLAQMLGGTAYGGDNWNGQMNTPQQYIDMGNGSALNAGLLMGQINRYGFNSPIVQQMIQRDMASSAGSRFGLQNPNAAFAASNSGRPNPMLAQNQPFNLGGSNLNPLLNDSAAMQNPFARMTGNNPWLTPSASYNSGSFAAANPILASLMGPYYMGQSSQYSNPFQSNSFFSGYQPNGMGGMSYGQNNPFQFTSPFGSWGNQGALSALTNSMQNTPFGSGNFRMGSKTGQRANNSLYF